MNTQKEKQNTLAMRKRTLLASQNALSEEIDEVIKMLHPIGFDDLPFIEEKLKLMFEPSEKEVA